MKPLGDTIPKKNDGNGTMAVIELDGEPIFGVSSDFLLNGDADKTVSKTWQHLSDNYSDEAESFHHGEAHALFRAYRVKHGKLPENMTMYVDRMSCPNCHDMIPNLMKSLDINNLTIVFKNGRIADVTKQKFKLRKK